MCVCPVTIKNPYYGQKHHAKYKDISSTHILVPCGHCPECYHTRQLGIIQRVMLESMFGYPFFVTLTYNNEMLPHLTTSTGYDIRYADFKDVTRMLKRIRNDNLLGRNFRYLFVSELGTQRARPHFHGLVFLEKLPEDNAYTPQNLEKIVYDVFLSQWKRKVGGSKRNPIYKPCCTFIQKYIRGKLNSTYDCHFVCPSSLNGSTSDVSFYVTKYMMKWDKHSEDLQSALKLNLDDDEYQEVWNLVKSRWISSLNFGFATYGLQVKNLPLSSRLAILENTKSWKIVRDSIDRSVITSDSPKFFSPDDGRPLPLSRYWRGIGALFTVDDLEAFRNKNPLWRPDNVIIDDKDWNHLFKSACETYKAQVNSIDSKNFNLDLLFD